ncbi:hypothetical protein M5K25_001754 [Dendrobium thyrsiflorum]|uniref:Homeobox domain-containing protein n=1 Tax=Dendrobium thyrsiflorum TaxID=117978 RepID=A0ABD0VRN1_DENTH
MSQDSHHLHHHQHHYPFNNISAINNHSSMNNFEQAAAGNHDPFTLNMPTPNLRCLVPETAPITWPGESSSMMRPIHTNQVQSLSLSLFNPPQPPSFQISSHHPLQIKSCKYLLPAQQLLNEFCSLGLGNNVKTKNNNKLQDESGASWSQQALYTMEPLELQRRKAKLFTMLEEVDRRYRKYSEQMKAVVSTFEDIAGGGAARTYSMLAWKAMSRHFRCLRDGISGQIKAIRKAMGEKDGGITSGLTRGETPRLKIIDQCLRQQKAFQHPSGMMESHPWRPQRGLPERSVSILRAWLFEHFLHPYPSDVDKHILARQTGLSRSQVSNWFINARVRLWKPMVEEMYLEELNEETKICQSSHATSMQEGDSNNQPSSNPNLSSSSEPHFDQGRKSGMLGHLHHIDEPHSLTSIISTVHTHHHPNPNPNPNLNPNFDNLEVDHFDSYHGQELTLGLQHHEGDAMQFSVLVGEGQSIPYRNLMGAQLLRDLTG